MKVRRNNEQWWMVKSNGLLEEKGSDLTKWERIAPDGPPLENDMG